MPPFDNCTFMGAPITFSNGRPASPATGSMMYDALTHTYQVFDGSQWRQVTAEMMPNPSYQMTEDERLCMENPGLADLKRQLDEAKEKYEAFKALVKE